MRFALTIPAYRDPGARDPYEKTYELCRVAEEAGFDAGFMGHHSFTPGFGDAAAPFVLLAAIAARTERLRLGTSIFLLPLHHPVAIAEQVAVLDSISNGRAILGVGIGYRPYEYEGFGVPFRRRGRIMDEALELIRSAWTTGSFAYEGRHFQVPDLPVQPRPVQEPHPPIWVGAVARAAQDRAARLGDGWISDLMQTLPVERRLAERYREQCKVHGREPLVCLMRNACIAATREEVERDWLPGAVAGQLAYWKAGARGRDDEGLFARLEAGEQVSLEDFARDRAIAGTPADCVEQVRRCREATDCDTLLVSLGGRRDPAATRTAIERFGNEVIPAFA